jgi:hypothetical protein
MHNSDVESPERLAGPMFEHAESRLEEAHTIARHLVASNLVGHDSQA